MRVKSTVLLLLGYVALSVYGDETIKILRIFPETEVQLIGIKKMNKHLKFKADFLVPVYTTGIPGDLLVSSKDLSKVTNYLDTLGVEYKEIENKEPPMPRRRRSASQRIEAQDVKGSYLSYDEFGYPSPVGVKKPLIFVNCGIHAREWIASATCVNIMWKLGYETDWKDLLEQIDIVIVPNSNPDGYEYTRENQTGARYWTKNWNGPYPGTYTEFLPNGTQIDVPVEDCYGVDLNRNFPFMFDYVDEKNDVSRDKDGCSRFYSGPKALSELETSNLYNSIKSKLKNMKGFLDIHSYSQLILLPWGYGYNIENENINDLRRVATVLRESMDTYNGTQYRIMSTPELYPTIGALTDSVHALGVKYSYTIEMPPWDTSRGFSGFEMPVDQIPEVSDGIFRGLIGLAKEIIKENPLPSKTEGIQKETMRPIVLGRKIIEEDGDVRLFLLKRNTSIGFKFFMVAIFSSVLLFI